VRSITVDNSRGDGVGNGSAAAMRHAEEARADVERDAGRTKCFDECARHQIEFARPSVDAVEEADEVRAVVSHVEALSLHPSMRVGVASSRAPLKFGSRRAGALSGRQRRP